MRVLGLAALLAALASGGCGASRRAPRPYPGASSARPTAPPPGLPGDVAAPLPGAPLDGGSIASLALSFRGTPYENGGAGPGGFDCSGLVHFVFARAGMALPRSVRGQLAAGVPVDGEPQPGDLVFFAIDGEHVSHVGIATGPATFVHAPSSRGVVRLERLDAAYWARRIAAVRRISSCVIRMPDSETPPDRGPMEMAAAGYGCRGIDEPRDRRR